MQIQKWPYWEQNILEIGNNEVHYTNNNSTEDLILLEQLIDDILYYIKRELRLAKAKEISESK